MNRCQKCNVVILDDTDRCPLCQHVLETDGTKGENRYPDAIEVTRRFRFLENLVLFLSIVVETILVIINYTVDKDVAWSLIAGNILLYLNVVLRMAVLGKSGYMAKTVSLILLAVVLLLGIDYLTGYNRWSLDYVFPGGILAIDVTLLVLILVNRRNWQSYLTFQIWMIVFSALPLLVSGLIGVSNPIVFYIALFVSIACFLGTWIIGGPKAPDELKRRFHI